MRSIIDLESAVGPTLTEHLTLIVGCIKFPAPYAGGRPVIPVIVNCDMCALFKRFWNIVCPVVSTPYFIGSSVDNSFHVID